MKHVWFVLPAVVAAAIALLLTPLVARLATRVGAVDMPGERKVHKSPVPRLGGLAVVAAIAVALAGSWWLSAGRWSFPTHLAPSLILGLLPIFIVSLIDDIRSVGALPKLAAHLLGAGIAVSLGVSLDSVVHLFGTPIAIGWLAFPVSVLWIAGVTNAFNIIDGLDGLSAGLALISALSMSAVFALVGQPQMAGVSLVLAGGLAGFLPYNIHPARLFLGDVGAASIGFCLAVFALRGGSTLSTGFAALMPLFILGLPIADTLVAMVRRVLHKMEYRKGGMFVADGNHIHHRLLALGVDHARAVLILYAAGIVFAAAALVSVFLSTREAAFVLVALLLAGVVGIQRLGYEEFAFLRRGTVLRVYEMPVVQRGFFVVFVDMAIATISAYVSLGLKTDQWSVFVLERQILEIAVTMAPITVVVFQFCGMYRGSWRVAGLQDLTRVVAATAISAPTGAIVLKAFSEGQYQLSFFGIYFVVSLLLTAAVRASYVVLESTRQRSSLSGTPVLIYGAGGRGVAAMRELFQDSQRGLRPVGFVDDDIRKRSRVLNGLPVLGTGSSLPALLKSSGARAVIISTARIPADRIERVAEACREAGAKLFRIDITVEQLGAGDTDVPLFEAPRPGPRRVIAPEPVQAASGASSAALLSEPCPQCKGVEVHRSKARNMLERYWKIRTPKRLFRCHVCGWRGWLMPMQDANSVTFEALPALPIEIPGWPAEPSQDKTAV